MIYVSTIVTVGASPDNKPIDETIQFNLGGYNVPYIDTKREAEDLALAANSPELEVVVVNPSIMISPPDRPVTQRDLRKIPRFLPAYFDFGLNVVETDDVITGIIAAITKGRPGERYLLTGENINPERLFVLSKKYFGISKPISENSRFIIIHRGVVSGSLGGPNRKTAQVSQRPGKISSS